MKRGEIRRVSNWDYVGHEATGNRPCLIISPDWFNSTGNVIIAPLTTVVKMVDFSHRTSVSLL